jgi:hypothetical protein
MLLARRRCNRYGPLLTLATHLTLTTITTATATTLVLSRREASRIARLPSNVQLCNGAWPGSNPKLLVHFVVSRAGPQREALARLHAELCAVCVFVLLLLEVRC